MTDWEAKAEEACARLGITDEKTRAFVFEHERTHAKMQALYIPEGHGVAFFALLRTMPDEEAVALATHAVRNGPDRGHNQRELFRVKGFADWLVEMDAKGMFGTPTTAEQVRAELDARDRELHPEAYEGEDDA